MKVRLDKCLHNISSHILEMIHKWLAAASHAGPSRQSEKTLHPPHHFPPPASAYQTTHQPPSEATPSPPPCKLPRSYWQPRTARLLANRPASEQPLQHASARLLIPTVALWL